MESRALSSLSPACSAFHTIFLHSFCICPCTELNTFFMWDFPQIPQMNSIFAMSFLSWGKQRCTQCSRTSITDSAAGFIHEYVQNLLHPALRAVALGLFAMVLNEELRSYTECCRAADQGKARAVSRMLAALLVLPLLCSPLIPLCLYFPESSQPLLHTHVPEPVWNRTAPCKDRRSFSCQPLLVWIFTSAVIVGSDAVWHSHSAPKRRCSAPVWDRSDKHYEESIRLLIGRSSSGQIQNIMVEFLPNKHASQQWFH